MQWTWRRRSQHGGAGTPEGGMNGPNSVGRKMELSLQSQGKRTGSQKRRGEVGLTHDGGTQRYPRQEEASTAIGRGRRGLRVGQAHAGRWMPDNSVLLSRTKRGGGWGRGGLWALDLPKSIQPLNCGHNNDILRWPSPPMERAFGADRKKEIRKETNGRGRGQWTEDKGTARRTQRQGSVMLPLKVNVGPGGGQPPCPVGGHAPIDKGNEQECESLV